MKERALDFHRHSGVPANECRAYNEIARVYAVVGDTDRARACFGAALSIAVDLGLEHEEGRALAGLGLLDDVQEPDVARNNLSAALKILQRLSPTEADELRQELLRLQVPIPMPDSRSGFGKARTA